jgi:hypothetical protein
MTLKDKGTADFTTQKSMIAARQRYLSLNQNHLPNIKYQTSKGVACCYLPKRAGV